MTSCAGKPFPEGPRHIHRRFIQHRFMRHWFMRHWFMRHWFMRTGEIKDVLKVHVELQLGTQRSQNDPKQEPS